MIIQFYYKGAVIHTSKLDDPFTKRGKEEVRTRFRQGLIKKPGNWDRYELVREGQHEIF